jgi:hypothetical protein
MRRHEIGDGEQQPSGVSDGLGEPMDRRLTSAAYLLRAKNGRGRSVGAGSVPPMPGAI